VHTTLASRSGGPQDEANHSAADEYLFQAAVKRVLDVAVAALLLLVLLPVLATVAVLVACTSPGPVLFRQQRVGRDGRLFWFYKFRTMFDGNDPAAHRAYYVELVTANTAAAQGAYKLVADPRVTSVGRVLRRFSFDELPQLLNVVKGDMSLVGPRPPIPYEVELYGPRERARLSVTPGLTGLWQVSGRSTLSFKEMIELDLAYINNWSLGLDLLILLRTPWAILSGRGAY